MITRRMKSACGLALLAFGISGVQAESAIDGYSHIVKHAQEAQPLGADLFGDQINMMNGATEFRITDVSIPTNGSIPVSIGRTLRVDAQTADQQGRTTYWGNAAFGPYWDLDVPYMSGTFDAVRGWVGASVTGSSSEPPNLSRCSLAGNGPPPVNGVGAFYSVSYTADDFFSGITINVPGSGSEQMLKFQNYGTKAVGGRTYYGTTRKNWLVGCTPSIKNGLGEGFVVLLPNGTSYKFDWIASRMATYILDDTCHVGADIFPTAGALYYGSTHYCTSGIAVPRNEVFLYATEATDRFGNKVTYTYDSQNPEHLTSVASSDGSVIDVGYGTNNHIATIKANGRTWSYVYDSPYVSLKNVVLPDGSKWTYAYGSNMVGVTRYDAKKVWRGCTIHVDTKTTGVSPGPSETNTMTITHPSGAVGTFEFRQILHGTRQAEPGCTIIHVSATDYSGQPTVHSPSDYQTASLYRKTIAGPGLVTQQWNYTYHPSWNAPYQSETIVTDLYGISHHYIYGNDAAKNYGHLLQMTIGSLSGTLRSETYQYLESAVGQNFDDAIGRTLSVPGMVWGGSFFTFNRPLYKTTIAQQGTLFTNTINTGCLKAGAYCFDGLLRPLSMTKSSAPSP